MAGDRSSFQPTTANDRFKRGYPRSTYIGVTVAVAVHFLLLQFSPPLTAADVPLSGPDLDAIPEVWLPRVTVELPPPPPKVDIPKPRRPIVRPRTPVVADVVLGGPFDHLKAPVPLDWRGPRPQEPEPPVYVGRDVEPSLQNRRQIQRSLVRLYPSMLREAGIGGTVLLWVFVDEKGAPVQVQMIKTSGYPAMDDAAAQVVSKMEFTPAEYRKKPVGVWVQQVVSFKIN